MGLHMIGWGFHVVFYVLSIKRTLSIIAKAQYEFLTAIGVMPV
jgi:hypothetical protein